MKEKLSKRCKAETPSIYYVSCGLDWVCLFVFGFFVVVFLTIFKKMLFQKLIRRCLSWFSCSLYFPSFFSPLSLSSLGSFPTTSAFLPFLKLSYFCYNHFLPFLLFFIFGHTSVSIHVLWHSYSSFVSKDFLSFSLIFLLFFFFFFFGTLLLQLWENLQVGQPVKASSSLEIFNNNTIITRTHALLK